MPQSVLDVRAGDQVHYFVDNDREPSIAIVAKVDYANTEDNSRPRLHLSVLHADLAKWTSRHSVPLRSDDVTQNCWDVLPDR